MNEQSWNRLSIAAVVVMIALVAANFIWPKPTLGNMVRGRRAQELKLQDEIAKARDEVTLLKVRNAKRLWESPADQVGAAAMAKVTLLANQNELKVVAFRPQRLQDDAGVTIHPYQVSIDGYFPKVMAFIRALETPDHKLPVVSVQLAAADGATDRVSATIGIVAYREQETKR